jgi:hypothetical protein
MTDILDTPPEGHEMFVYLGSATDAKGKAHSLWISAAELDNEATAADYEAVRRAAGWYSSKGDSHRPIGGLYSIKCQRGEEGRCTMWFGTAKYSGQSAHPLIAVFQAKDAEARDMAYRAKNERKAKEPVYMRDMERTVEALRALPRRQALDVANAIAMELRNRILAA